VQFKQFVPDRLQLDKRRYYKVPEGLDHVPAGLVLPSVTTVAGACSPVGKIMALINWRKRVGDAEANRRTRNAVERGNWLHGVLEDLWNGEDIEGHLEVNDAYRPYFHSIEPFLETIDGPLLVESAIAYFNAELKIGYAGTFDMLAIMKNGNIALLDWKTSYKRKPDYQLADYKMQLGAYAQALEQMYSIEIDEAHCAISIYDPDTGEGEEAQILSLDGAELVCQATIMNDKTRRFFNDFYPGGKPFTITLDKGQ
jgi:genome maintenance exonuclease 1